MPVHWFDIAIVTIVALNTLSAFRHGLIRELVTVVALILGATLAGRYYGNLSENLSFVIDDRTTRNLIAFIAIFTGIAMVGQIVSTFLRTAAGLLMLGPVDHLGGAAFGLLKGVLLVELLLVAVTAFPAASGLTTGAEQSAFAPMFLKALPLLSRLLPDEFHQAIDTLKVSAALVTP